MLNCIECNGKLKVTITGGEFLVKDGSTEDNINFEKTEKIDFATAEVLDADVMLEIHIECSNNPAHRIFGHTDSKIRQEIYQRIASAAIKLRNKYHNIS